IPIFLACRYLHDCKNPQNRNQKRNRFAYFTALKGPSTTADNGLSKESIITQDTQLKSSSFNSLDRIQKLSEVGEDLIEVKNANGKIFYVEDTKSENSTVTLGGTESPSREDEQSVIAMLDDVLDAEGIQHQQMELDQQNHIFERHFSLDSEMYPSVIETVIVATVHSSSEDDEVVSHQSLQLRKYKECRMFAQQMLDEMFNSVVFAEQLKAALVSQGAAEPQEKNDSKDILRDKSKHRCLESDTSVRSQASAIEYPMHSDKFKERLSQIIMNASPLKVITSMKRKGEPEPEESEAEVEPAVRPKRPLLNQSKSETDVRRLMLKAINGLKIDHSEDGNVFNVSCNSYATHTYSAKQDPNSSIVKPAGHIPRPPKFDPNLHKTIKSINLRKHRPSLSQQQVVDAKNLEVAATLVSSTELEPELEPAQGQDPQLVPFKSILEAILKRGPSHRTQQRTDPVRRQRPQSTRVGAETEESER
ncbi:Hypothetical predicted protein, partial [Drosophila guanche]